MKKIVKIILILLISFSIFANITVCKALSANVNINSEKDQFGYNETFSVEVSLGEISAEKGILVLTGELAYDENVLAYTGMEVQNAWENVEYNPANRKFVADRGTYQDAEEVVLRITFTVIANQPTSTEISMSNLIASNGIEENQISASGKFINIVDPNQNENMDQNQQDNTTPTEDPNQYVEQTPDNQYVDGGQSAGGTVTETKPKSKPSTSGAIDPWATNTNGNTTGTSTDTNANTNANVNVVGRNDTNNNTNNETNNTNTGTYTTEVATLGAKSEKEEKSNSGIFVFIICIVFAIPIAILIRKYIMERKGA